jgi:hypothetical protein
LLLGTVAAIVVSGLLSDGLLGEEGEEEERYFMIKDLKRRATSPSIDASIVVWASLSASAMVASSIIVAIIIALVVSSVF